jgi:hypothetical protein
MKRLVSAVLMAVAFAVLSAHTHAFSIAIDVPTQYTLDNRALNKQTNAKANNQVLTDVGGYKVLIGSIYHVGVGYEQYTVKGNGKSDLESFRFESKIQFYDVFLDLPTSVLNFTLGYGKGRVNVNVLNVPDPPVFAEADASQFFAGVGFPIGPRFDLHVAYHAVSTEDLKPKNSSAANDPINVSGHTVMAGLRLAW